MNAFQYLYFALLYTTLGISLWRYRRFTLNLRLITLYLASHVLVDSLAIYLYLAQGVTNNLFLYHIFTPLEYLILAGVFATSIRQSSIRVLIGGSVPLLFVLAFVSARWLTGLHQNNTYPVALTSLLVITWSLLLLKELFLHQPVSSPARLPMFWISMGLLVYYVGTMLVETSINYFMTYSMPLARTLYQSEYVFEYLLLVTILIEIYQQRPVQPVRTQS